MNSRLGADAVLKQLQVGRNLLAPRRKVDIANGVAGRADDTMEVRRWERQRMDVLRSLARPRVRVVQVLFDKGDRI